MTKRILLYDSKLHDTDLLAEQITAAGDYILTRPQTMRQAGDVLTVHQQDLALIPITRNDSLVYTLRMLQPNLTMFLIRHNADQFIPERQRQAVAGVVDAEAVPHVLIKLLNGRWSEKDLHYRPQLILPEVQQLTENQIEAALNKLLEQEALRLAIIIYQNTLYPQRSTADKQQLAASVERLKKNHLPKGTSFQITHLNGVDDHTNILLFSRQIGRDLHITLGAELHTSIGRLRRLTDNTAQQLINADAHPRPSSQPAVPANHFALVWQSEKPIASGMTQVIHNILHQIATVYHCQITYLDVHPSYVNMLVTVPDGRTSGWAARIFKHHSDSLLRKALNTDEKYWADGFLAQAADRPLSTAELKLFLRGRQQLSSVQ